MQFEPIDAHNPQQAIDILAAAFRDDPVVNWTCNRPQSLVPFFDITLQPFLPHGLCYQEAEGRGAAVWLGPGHKLKWPVRLTTVRKVLGMGGLRAVARMLRSGAATERHHPQGPPHYYLFAIGVTPGNQGRGLGSALISHVLRRCDAEGVPAYLENSKPANLAFYEGHGFAVQQEIRFARSAPPVWLMWREPRGGVT